LRPVHKICKRTEEPFTFECFKKKWSEQNEAARQGNPKMTETECKAKQGQNKTGRPRKSGRGLLTHKFRQTHRPKSQRNEVIEHPSTTTSFFAAFWPASFVTSGPGGQRKRANERREGAGERRKSRNPTENQSNGVEKGPQLGK
jgi:hypothetical protein